MWESCALCPAPAAVPTLPGHAKPRPLQVLRRPCLVQASLLPVGSWPGLGQVGFLPPTHLPVPVLLPGVRIFSGLSRPVPGESLAPHEAMEVAPSSRLLGLGSGSALCRRAGVIDKEPQGIPSKLHWSCLPAPGSPFPAIDAPAPRFPTHSSLHCHSGCLLLPELLRAVTSLAMMGHQQSSLGESPPALPRLLWCGGGAGPLPGRMPKGHPNARDPL